MQRLLEDAEKLSGFKYDISSYGDIVDAIHVVQTEMGITGTTAKEASSTISGSLGMAKSAWKNLVVGIADDTQDFDALAENFVESVGTAAENILPRVEIALEGIGKLVEKLLPVIVESIPKIAKNILPDMLKSGTQLLIALTKGIVSALPELVPCFKMIVTQLVQVITENLPIVANAALSIIEAIIECLLDPKTLSQIIEAGVTLLVSLVEKIPEIIELITAVLPDIIDSIVYTLLDHIDEIIEAGIKLLTALIDALPEIITVITDKLPEIITAIFTTLTSDENLEKILEAGIELFATIATAIPEIIETLLEAVDGILTDIADAIGLGDLYQAGKDFFSTFFDGLKSVWEDVEDWVNEKVGWITSAFDKDSLQTSGNDLFSNSAQSIAGQLGGSNTTTRKIGTLNGSYHTARKHAKGGVVEKGEIAFLEGDGAEAVVPLEKNKQWISRVAYDMNNALNNQGGNVSNKTLEEILEIMKLMLNNMPDILADSLSRGVKFDINNREFGRLVRKAVTP